MGYKAVAIPVNFYNGKFFFLTVRDSRYKEWTFITGGCRKREIINPIRCALRELSEESRGAMRLYDGLYTTFENHITVNDEPCVYSAYIFLLNYSPRQMQNVIEQFYVHKEKNDLRKRQGLSVRISQDENDMITWESLDNFKTKKLWSVANEIAHSDILNNIESIQWKKFCPSIVYGRATC